jgi:hypothetical protein
LYIFSTLATCGGASGAERLPVTEVARVPVAAVRVGRAGDADDPTIFHASEVDESPPFIDARGTLAALVLDYIA